MHKIQEYAQNYANRPAVTHGDLWSTVETRVIIYGMEEKNYVYILECADGSLYTGWTKDPEKRLAAHNSGKGAKYTRTRLPVRIIYMEEFECKEDALSREWHIKQLSRDEKLSLIKRSQKK